MVEKIAAPPTFTYENGVWNMNIDSLVLPESFMVQERKLLFVPPGEHGGNHSHPRQEIFFSTDPSMRLIWQSTDGVVHQDAMVGDNGSFFMFYVHAHTPHAVVNEGTHSVLLLELADGLLTNVEPADLLNA